MMDSPEKFVLLTSLLCFPLLFLSFVFELFAKSEQPFANVAFIILGMVYIGIPFALLDFIAFDADKFYTNTILGLLVLTWANDTGAYLVGSQIGKTKLFPSISPKKTWEGSIGGVVITIFIAILMSFFFEECTMVQWIVLAIIVVIFGSIGDLVESMLKRSYSIKDSGNLLPGHGGFLDRFDAFIFLIPFATAYLLWLRT
jgi:phosphatidate cytidylyltransferase